MDNGAAACFVRAIRHDADMRQIARQSHADEIARRKQSCLAQRQLRALVAEKHLQGADAPVVDVGVGTR